MAYLPLDQDWTLSSDQPDGVNLPMGQPPPNTTGMTPTLTGTPLGQDWINNFNETQTPTGPLPNGQGTQVGYTPLAAPDEGGTGTWGGPIAPYAGDPYPNFTPPPLPDVLSRPYELPTADALKATPGYMARYQQGMDALQRSAAARGTLLNGGTQKALTRYGQDYASNEYNNLVRQGLSARQQQASDYLNLAYGPAWQQNAAAVNKYGTLYGQYQDLIGNNRNAMNDYYGQQLELAKLGLSAAGAGNPGTGAA